MGITNWIGKLFRGKSKELDQIPEILGYDTDEQGNQIAIRRGEVKHESLSDDQIQRVKRLQEVLIEAYPMSIDGWVDGFLRDANPESEIQIIEACAFVYHRLATTTNLSSDEKQRIYGVLCLISAGGSEEDLASAIPAKKGLPDFQTIASMFRETYTLKCRP
jgi:hypothetical protein